MPIISYNAASLCGSRAVGASIVVDRALGFSHAQRHRAIVYFMEETSNVYRSPHAASVLSGTAMHRRDGEFGPRRPSNFCRKTVGPRALNGEYEFGRSLPVPVIIFNIRFEGPTVDSQTASVTSHKVPQALSASS